MGLVVPDRAVWLRTLLAEHTRILSQPGSWLGGPRGRATPDLPAPRGAARADPGLTGNRIHPMVNRIGGLAADADPDWLRAETWVMAEAGRSTACCSAWSTPGSSRS